MNPFWEKNLTSVVLNQLGQVLDLDLERFDRFTRSVLLFIRRVEHDPGLLQLGLELRDAGLIILADLERFRDLGRVGDDLGVELAALVGFQF